MYICIYIYYESLWIECRVFLLHQLLGNVEKNGRLPWVICRAQWELCGGWHCEWVDSSYSNIVGYCICVSNSWMLDVIFRWPVSWDSNSEKRICDYYRNPWKRLVLTGYHAASGKCSQFTRFGPKLRFSSTEPQDLPKTSPDCAIDSKKSTDMWTMG